MLPETPYSNCPTAVPCSRLSFRCRTGARLVLLVCLTGNLSGCLFDWFGGSKTNLKPIQSNLSTADLIEHVNANARQLHAWRCTNATISTRPSKMIPMRLTLSAIVAVERDRNFRLRARSPMGDEADFGSNDERFWFWLRRSSPAELYTSRHEHMDLVAERLPIPLQPEWIMEALGVAEINPRQIVSSRMGTEPNTILLTLSGVSPAGAPVQRELVLDTRLGVVTAHRLYSRHGVLIAQAQMSRHQREPSGVVMPHRVELAFPQSETTLTLDLSEIETNPSDMAISMWELPKLPNTPTRDIGEQLARTQDPRVRRRVRPVQGTHLPTNAIRTVEAPPFSDEIAGWQPTGGAQPKEPPPFDPIMPAAATSTSSSAFGDAEFREPPPFAP